jgi:hypothetical protein
MNKVIYERFDYAGGAGRQDRRRALSFLAVGAGLASMVGGFALVP